MENFNNITYTNNNLELDKWNIKKKFLNQTTSFPTPHKGEVWWAAEGRNIGSELNGKGRNFARPVLVFKTFDRYNFLTIPFTTRPHEGTWYAPLLFHNKPQSAVLSQIRTMHAARLYEKIGELPEKDFINIKKRLFALIFC